MLRRVLADFHVHTVLSPCAEFRMVPELIVKRAIEAGLDLLAVTDHNSGENAGAVVMAARNSGLSVLPGMEVESREGVHMLALFDELEALACWQTQVYAALPDRQNDERRFGVQLVVDSEGNLVAINRRMLVTATNLSVETIAQLVEERGGLCIPAHVDRPANGLFGVLGFLPEDYHPAGIEISRMLAPEEAVARYPQLASVAILQSSDAHLLDDVGCASTALVIEEPSILEISRACRGEMGRRLAA